MKEKSVHFVKERSRELNRLNLKDVDDFDESNGVTYGDQMIEARNKCLMTRAELEKREDALENRSRSLLAKMKF
jgi:hypothetical protein